MAIGELKLRRAELRLAKKEAGHRRTMDYFDRLSGIVLPVVTNPVALFMGSYIFINYAANKAVSGIDRSNPLKWLLTFGEVADITTEATLMKGTLSAAFIGNAFGGPAGITQVIKALK